MRYIFFFSLVLLMSAPSLLAKNEDISTAPVATTIETSKQTTSKPTTDVIDLTVKKPATESKPEHRYIVVDAQKIIAETKLDQEPVQELLKLQQSLQKEIKDLSEDIQKEEASLKAKASTLSPDAFKKKQEELEEKNQKAQLKLQRANKQLQDEEMKTRFKVFQELHQDAQKMVDADSTIDIVFEKSGGILAYSKRVDGSDELSKVVRTDLAKKEAAKKKDIAKNGQDKNDNKKNASTKVAA